MIRLLLDSHIFVWYITPTFRLRDDAVDSIRNADQVYVSAATIWELTIKRASGKLDQGTGLIDKAREYGFLPLSITQQHGEAIGRLARHHRDPFDHLLLAQAKVESLTLVTHDEVLARYGVPVLLV